MAEQTGIGKLQQWQQRWMSYQIMADVLMAAAWAIFAGSIAWYIFTLPWAWGIAVFVIVFAGLLLMHRPWQITDTDVSRYLNTVYSELEESCELVLMPSASLNVLESLQRHKVEIALSHLK